VTPGPKALFAAGKNGFAVVEATTAEMAVMLID
jgi:hypothetical protein